MKSRTLSRPLRGWAWFSAWALLTVVIGSVTCLAIGSLQIGPSGPWAAQWLLTVLATGVILGGAGLLIWSLRSWRNAKRLLLFVGSALCLVALAYALEDVRGWLAWRHFKGKWEAKGEKFDFSQFVPPPVPEDKNFAMAPVVYTSYGWILDKAGRRVQNPGVVNRLQMPLEANNDGPTNGIGNWQKGVRSDLGAWQAYYRGLKPPDSNSKEERMQAAFAKRYGLRPANQPPPPSFPVSPTPQTPAKDVLLALSLYDQTIEELRAAAELPETRFPLNYDAELPAVILLPHLASMKGCSQVLRLRALAELSDGRPEVALNDIVLALELTEKLRKEPFLITHLVRIAMFSLTEQAIWEGMVDHRWNDAQLSRLANEINQFDFAEDWQRAMRGENACCASTISYVMRHRSSLSNLGSEGMDNSQNIREITSYLMPSGWFRQSEVRCSRFVLEKYLPIADEQKKVFYPRLADAAGEEVNRIPRGPYTLLAKILLPAIAKGAGRFAQAQATANLTLAACAAERYRAAHGKYPQSLADTVPDFIARVPTDPFASVSEAPQPLRYRLAPDDKFIAYSIGPDLKDDGGTLELNRNGSIDFEKSDVVWRFPN